MISQTLELCSMETVLRLLLTKGAKLSTITQCLCFQGRREGVETVQNKDIRNTGKWICACSAASFSSPFLALTVRQLFSTSRSLA